MRLSSNWSKLQDGVTKKAGKKRIDKKPHIIKKVGQDKKPKSKIMGMIYQMNKEIDQQKENKKVGKKFEFTDTITEIDTVETTTETKKDANKIGKYIAMDCEFVGVGPEGKDSALARVSLVNFHGNVVLDIFVKPRETVTDWRTWVSGITPDHMKNAVSFKQAQQQLSDILKDKILVGHAVKHDLEALMLSHPKSKVIDTARHLPFRQKYAKGKSPSLKKLAKEILNMDIQSGQHSSVEDARATMLIYKSAKQDFDKEHRKKFH
ncbi:Exonuclease [Nakaseomyces glabratus]|nr:Exonuclease [Nakaseomyces glabratus]KAH7590426.1 Exonuclease [Nakaseomyces glabratus]KAI8396136.1 Exonuclease [Nakaseomyces glabratus]